MLRQKASCVRKCTHLHTLRYELELSSLAGCTFCDDMWIFPIGFTGMSDKTLLPQRFLLFSFVLFPLLYTIALRESVYVWVCVCVNDCLYCFLFERAPSETARHSPANM